MFAIYALLDPRDGALRYVGCTMFRLADRVSGHVSEARQGGTRPCTCWVREVLDAELRPLITQIDTAPDRVTTSMAERWWIDHLRSLGHALTNVQRGGLPKRVYRAESYQGNAGRLASPGDRRHVASKQPRAPQRRAIRSLGLREVGTPRRGGQASFATVVEMPPHLLTG